MPKRTAQKDKKQDVIITIGAHNDDYILGAGGTVAKYLDEGKRVIHIIFSYGEKSHPWLQKEVTKKMRMKESFDAEKRMGGSDLIYLGLTEGRFLEEFDDRKSFLVRIIKKYEPVRIFTHVSDDPHPDHRAVHHIVKQFAAERIITCPIYSFNVWNIMNLRKQGKAKLIVDITPYMKKKIQAFKKHESQRIVIFLHLWSIYVKAFFNGMDHGFKYAEVFYKEK